VAALTTAVATAGQPTTTESSGPGATGAPAPASTLALAANPAGQLRYDKTQATVKAGNVTIRFVNRSALPHNVTIARGNRVVAQTKTIQGATANATANLPAGSYVFYCSVDAHRQAGMQGRLTVR